MPSFQTPAAETAFANANEKLALLVLSHSKLRSLRNSESGATLLSTLVLQTARDQFVQTKSELKSDRAKETARYIDLICSTLAADFALLHDTLIPSSKNTNEADLFVEALFVHELMCPLQLVIVKTLTEVCSAKNTRKKRKKNKKKSGGGGGDTGRK